MASSDLTELESRVRRWIRKKAKETSRVEFKLIVPLRPVGAKAEFIRDVIALANSEGEFPRQNAYLIIGFSEGKLRDVAPECYDGAALGQILDSHILYQEFYNGKNGRVGVLIIKPDSDVPWCERNFLMTPEKLNCFQAKAGGGKQTARLISKATQSTAGFAR